MSVAACIVRDDFACVFQFLRLFDRHDVRAAVREIQSRWTEVFRAGRLRVYAPPAEQPEYPFLTEPPEEPLAPRTVSPEAVASPEITAGI